MPQESVKQRLNATLQDRQALLAAINLAVLFLLVIVVQPFVDQRILWPLLAIHLLLQGTRLGLLWLSRRNSSGRDWLLRSLVPISVLSGLAWGCTALLLPGSNSVVVVIAVTVVLAGMCSGAVVGLAAVPAAFYGFILSTALPYIIVQIVMADPWAPVLAGSAIVYGTGIALIGRQLHGLLSDSITLGVENRELVGQLNAARQALERRVTEQQTELDALLDTVPAYIWIAYKHDTRNPRISRHAIERLHLSATGRPLKPFRMMSEGVEISRQKGPMACAMRGEAIENFELSLAYEDGTRVDQIVNAVPLRDAEGTVVGAVGASIDITSRMHAEEELKRSEARFRDFAESAADWLWETDADHRFIWMSDNVEKLTGVPPAWHYGKTRFELMRVNTGIDLTAISADTEMWADHLRTLEARLPFRDLEYLRHGPKSDHWLSVSGIPIFREDGTFGGYRGVGRDITDRKTAEHRARFLADHDPLTSLPNRRLLSDRLSAMRSQASVPGNKIALAFVDVDHFKLVNDSLGHQAGDRFLVEIGRRLSRCVGGRGLVARFGGDEFAVAIGPVGNIDKARTVCSDMLDAMREPMQADGERFIPSISIGVAIYPDDALNDENLMRNADRALYRAKNKGRDRVCFFDDDLDQLIQQ